MKACLPICIVTLCLLLTIINNARAKPEKTKLQLYKEYRKCCRDIGCDWSSLPQNKCRVNWESWKWKTDGAKVPCYCIIS